MGRFDDEFFHEPGEEEYWSESHYLDFVGDEIQGHVRIGFYPNQESVNVWTYVVANESIYWIADKAVAPGETHGLNVETDAWTLGLYPTTPENAWRFELEGTVTKSETPEDVRQGRGELVSMDLSFESIPRHDPFYYSDGQMWPQQDGHDRYELATRVDGSVTIDGSSIAFDARGERDHSWGPREWVGDAEWLWISGAFDDGTAYNHLSAWVHGFPDTRFVNGFWYDGTETYPFTGATLDANPAFGSETARDWATGNEPAIELILEWANDAARIEVDPFVTTPMVFEKDDDVALFNRSAARQQKDGVGGVGWLENIWQDRYNGS